MIVRRVLGLAWWWWVAGGTAVVVSTALVRDFVAYGLPDLAFLVGGDSWLTYALGLVALQFAVIGAAMVLGWLG